MFTHEELTIIKNIATLKEYNLNKLKKDLENFSCYKKVYPFLEKEIELHKSIKGKCSKMILNESNIES